MKWVSINKYVDLETCEEIKDKETTILRDYYIVTKPSRTINYGKTTGYITYTRGVRKKPKQGGLFDEGQQGTLQKKDPDNKRYNGNRKR